MNANLKKSKKGPRLYSTKIPLKKNPIYDKFNGWKAYNLRTILINAKAKAMGVRASIVQTYFSSCFKVKICQR